MEKSFEMVLAEMNLAYAMKMAEQDNTRANKKAVHAAKDAIRQVAYQDKMAELEEKFSGAVDEARRRRMTMHKHLNKMQKVVRVKDRKAKHTPPTGKIVIVDATRSASMANAQDEYVRTMEWLSKKQQDKVAKTAPATKVPETTETTETTETAETTNRPVAGAEKLVRIMEKEAERHPDAVAALNDNMAAKLAKIDKAIASIVGQIDDAEKAVVAADFQAKAEKNIEELKDKLLKLVERKEKISAKTAEHLKKVAAARFEAEAKAALEAEREEIKYLFRFGDRWAETMQAADVAAREAVDAWKDIEYRYDRMVKRYEHCLERIAELKPQQKTLKAKRTRLQRKYAAADKAKQAEIYKDIRQLNADTNGVIKELEDAKAELHKAEDDLVAYALAMPEMKAAADRKIAEACEHKQEILALIKRESRYAKLQDALEETFEQRYERGDYVPEKEDAQRYKVYNIPFMKLYAKQVQLLKKMNQLVAVPEEDREPGWLQQGKMLFQQFAASFKQMPRFVVNAMDCVVNNVAGSAMSDIMGVNYGQKNACKEMVLINYDTTALNVYWKFVGDTFKQAEDRMHKMRVYVVDRILREGVTMIVGSEEIHYDMLASSNSQQKKGQAYMGETETMKRTEKLREFGLTLDEAIANRPDNAPEWLKRNATLTTPSKIYKDKHGNTISIRKILMVDDVEIERMFEHVTTVDGKGKSGLHTEKQKKLKATLFDGQGLALKKGIPSSQMRGTALKFMLCALPEYALPEYATDIMGRRVRVADYDILLSKSCWKAAKMGMTWKEFVDTVTALAEICEGYDLMRSVRYSDREIGDEENPRNLARQATQQWVTLPDNVVEQLTRKTRRWLKNHKRFWTILSELGEWDKPVEERSALAKLFNVMPELVMHPYIQQWIETSWKAKKNKACSGRIRTKGQYPYIVQDPIAMIQIMLEGKDPNAEGLGVIPAGFVNLPKVTSGRKVYAIRYPANYIVGMILTQMNVSAFENLGNVAVISYYGDTIIRADGDFDGDEMLFIFDDVVIETMERIIREYNPSLIDFPHVKVACDKPFGDKETFITEVANALVRAQEYNYVGRYSNLAVRCLHMASVTEDALKRSKWLTAAKIAHVGAILCLDLVKGGITDEVKDLLNVVENTYDSVTAMCKMPWNQLFSHPELTAADVMERSESTQDRIAGLIFDDVGEFAVEFDENDKPVEWDNELFRLMWPSEAIKTTMFRLRVVPDEDIEKLRGCRFEDENDKETWRKMSSHEALGLAEWLMLGWHNSSSIVWKMTGADMAEKRNELDYYVRKFVMDNVRFAKWVSNDGHEFTLTEKYATAVKNIIGVAFGAWISAKGVLTVDGSKVDETRRGSFAMFVLRIFAQDILTFAENGGVVSDELVDKMTEPRPEQVFSAPGFFDEFEDDLSAISDDGTIEMVADDYEEGVAYFDDYPA